MKTQSGYRWVYEQPGDGFTTYLLISDILYSTRRQALDAGRLVQPSGILSTLEDDEPVDCCTHIPMAPVVPSLTGATLPTCIKCGIVYMPDDEND